MDCWQSSTRELDAERRGMINALPVVKGLQKSRPKGRLRLLVYTDGSETIAFGESDPVVVTHVGIQNG